MTVREAQGPALDDRTGIPDAWHIPTPFIHYDRATGDLLGHGVSSVAGLAHLEAVTGNAYLPVSGDPAIHYVDLSRAKPRRRVKAACPARLDGLTLCDLPIPCRIEISDPVFAPTVYAIEAAELDLVFDHPGTHTVRVLSAPYTPGVFPVEAP